MSSDELELRKVKALELIAESLAGFQVSLAIAFVSLGAMIVIGLAVS